MKMKRLVLCAIVAFLIVLLICSIIQKKHTITLSNGEGTIKAEQIQPLWGTVKVSGEKDKWYKVEGVGNLTLYPVSIRVE